jgi:hypothetical protein
MNKIYPLALLILTAMVVLSLTLNALTIATLLWVRDVALEEVADARSLVNGIRNTTFSHTIEVSKEIPVRTTVPFEEEVLVPVNTTIPLNTNVIVPIDLGPLGTYDIDIPIRAAIPINLEVAVPIEETIEIDTTVPLELTVPIEISVSETSLNEQLDKRDRALDKIERLLQNPFADPKVSIGVGE